MSWNTFFLIQKGSQGKQPASFLESLGLPGAQETESISFHEATSSGLAGQAIAESNGWTILTDPVFFLDLFPDDAISGGGVLLPLPLEQRLLAMSNEHPSYALLLNGVSDTYGFAAYENGECSRAILQAEDTTYIDTGATSFTNDHWAEDRDPEEMLLELLAEITGIESFDELPFTLCEVPPFGST
ncbi:hypothetical protein AB1L30_14945 [Bremerella sp. JC817]|uniref:hypothetical protein n=1 Tax=Bremerella sp. JC817 TaxID=3231756 RepID=UPI00345A273C